MRALLPLTLEGAHTRDVEALPSYLCRLASAHGVTPGVLMRILVQDSELEGAVNAALHSPQFAALARPNATSARFVEVLAAGRSENIYILQRSTFGFLGPALARTPSGYVRRLRWCPACLREQVMHTGTAYLKLAWFFSAVRTCGEHHIVLRDCCPHCGRVPRPWKGWATFELCPHCYRRLDAVTASDALIKDPEAAAVDLVDLVGEIAVAGEPFATGAANRYIARLFDEEWRKGSTFEGWNKLSLNECVRYSDEKEPLTLTAARRLAFRLELPIAALLRGDGVTNRSFPFSTSCPLPKSMQSAHRPGKINVPILLKQMRIFLEATRTPVSLREISRRLGVSVGAMRYYSPSLVLQLAKRYATFRRRVRELKNAAVVEAVVAGVHDWSHTSEIPISKKRLLRRLRNETGLPKGKLRMAIKVVLKDQVA